ncbi:hypothetical protein V7S43_013688 [Phytophthora oleae]|uniref:Uncharacterized protein n=1 Tax=Phytophthora oleae TaxID=2107226 RepID=A0ABD3F649_9STRA
MGKIAAFRQLLVKEQAGQDANTKGKSPAPPSPQKVSKKEQGREDHEGGQSTSACRCCRKPKKLEKSRERHRLEMEVKRWATARAESIARLKKEPQSVGKKEKRKTSPHESEKADNDADDENDAISTSGNESAAEILVSSPVEPPDASPRQKELADVVPATSTPERSPARTLDMDVQDDSVVPDEETVVPQNNGMTCDVEATALTLRAAEVEEPEQTADEEEADESCDDRLGGAAIAGRQKKNASQLSV